MQCIPTREKQQLWPNWPPFFHSYNRTGYSSSIMLRKKRLCIYHRFLFSSQVPAPTFVYFPVVNESKRADSAVPTLPQGKIKGTVLCKATFLVNIHGTYNKIFARWTLWTSDPKLANSHIRNCCTFCIRIYIYPQNICLGRSLVMDRFLLIITSLLCAFWLL